MGTITARRRKKMDRVLGERVETVPGIAQRPWNKSSARGAEPDPADTVPGTLRSTTIPQRGPSRRR